MNIARKGASWRMTNDGDRLGKNVRIKPLQSVHDILGIPFFLKGVNRRSLVVHNNAADCDNLADHANLHEAVLQRYRSGERRSYIAVDDVLDRSGSNLYLFHKSAVEVEC